MGKPRSPHQPNEDLDREDLESQETQPSSGERTPEHGGKIVRLKKFFGSLIGRSVEEPRPKSAREIRAEQIQAQVDEKLKEFPRTIRTGHPEMPEATDMRTERFYDFRKKLLKIASDDPKIWSLFRGFLERFPNGNDLLDSIDRAAANNPDFLKIFLKVAVEAGNEYCLTLIALKDPVYGRDTDILVSAESILTGISDPKKLSVILQHTRLFKGSVEKFGYFVEYLELHETFSVSAAQAFIEERLVRKSPYR